MIRTRFAPSPTGFLHIGGVRTALYSWLYAKKMGGKFILRVEDTDRERSTQESIDAIIEGMKWLELDHDEGPFYQMERLDRYQHHLASLLEKGLAYRCDCSKERLEKLREEQMSQKLKPRYDGHCRDRDLDASVPHVIRFKTPAEGSVGFHDLVYGDITVENSELDDLVLVRTDGVPTYNFSVVIDDWDMNISHVIRGDDHINNTPRQINLLKALDAPIPEYAHLPMILGQDGKRLSKRHGAVNVLAYKDAGYLPHTLITYLARLGWSHGDQEIFSMDELIEHFDFEHVHKGGATFSQEKLDWVSQHCIKATDDGLLADVLFETQLNSHEFLQRAGLEGIVALLKSRVHTLEELASKIHYFFIAPTTYSEAACDKHLQDSSLDTLEVLRAELKVLDSWDSDTISQLLKAHVKAHCLKFPEVAQPLRIALTGDTDTPSINEVLNLIGREEVDVRLGAAITHFKTRIA